MGRASTSPCNQCEQCEVDVHHEGKSCLIRAVVSSAIVTRGEALVARTVHKMGATAASVWSNLKMKDREKKSMSL